MAHPENSSPESIAYRAAREVAEAAFARFEQTLADQDWTAAQAALRAEEVAMKASLIAAAGRATDSAEAATLLLMSKGYE